MNKLSGKNGVLERRSVGVDWWADLFSAMQFSMIPFAAGHKLAWRSHRIFMLRLAGLLFLIVALTACGRTRKAPFGIHNLEGGWLLAGGDTTRSNFRPTGPHPPLELVAQLKLNSAPGQYLVAADRAIIVPTKDGRVQFYDMRQEKIRIRLKLPNKSEGVIAYHPAGYLLIGVKLAAEALQCYDVNTGKFIWRQQAGLLEAEPVPGDSSVYVVSRFRMVHRFHVRTGEQIWQFERTGMAHASPSLSRDLLIVGTDDGTVYALNRATGDKKWEAKVDGAIFASPVIADHRVFIATVDSTVAAFDLSSGDSLWQYRSDASIRYTPAFAKGLLIFGNGSGVVTALDAATGAEVWRYSSPPAFSTSPLVVDDIIYIGSLDRHLYILDIQSGQLLWKTELLGRVRTDPIVYGPYLIVGSEDRYVYVFREASPENTTAHVNQP